MRRFPSTRLKNKRSKKDKIQVMRCFLCFIIFGGGGEETNSGVKQLTEQNVIKGQPEEDRWKLWQNQSCSAVKNEEAFCVMTWKDLQNML